MVIIISKLLKRHSKPSANHQLIHERCVKWLNQRGCPKDSPWDVRFRLSEGERRQISR